MRLWNCKNPDVAMSLIPWFVPEGQNPIDMGWKLYTMLKTKPDDIFCLIALDSSIIQAILIAYKCKREVWLWQAHARGGFKYSKTMFNGLVSWTKGIGKKKIRMSTSQKQKAYQKRWGFMPCRWSKNVMELKI